MSNNKRSLVEPEPPTKKDILLLVVIIFLVLGLLYLLSLTPIVNIDIFVETMK